MIGDVSSSERAPFLDPDLRSRVLVTVLVVAIATFSLMVFTTNGLYSALNEAFSKGLLSLGLGFSMGGVLVAVLLMIVSIFALSVTRLKVILHLSTALFIPSALYFSNIDPFQILGFLNNFSDLGSTLPEIIVFLNGAVIVCGYIFLRSYRQVLILRANLLDRGAARDEVIVATRANLNFTLLIISVSLMIVIVIQVVIGLLSGTSFLIDAPVIALIALVLSLLFVASFLFQIGRLNVNPDEEMDSE